MYKVRKEMIEKLKNNITNREYANKLDISESFVSSVLNGKKECSKLVALGIIFVRHNSLLKIELAEELLNDFFIKKN